MIKHRIRLGKSLDLGTRTANFSATGTHARVRVGRVNEPALLEVLSTSPPPVGLCVWDIAEDGLSATLSVDLHQDQIAEIGAGTWLIELDAVRSTGEVLPIAEEEILILPSILAPAPA